jgi:alanine-glyoxylate transaminase/serine-glyoxylate transaminase/serine-pyruvate transaminase
VLAGIKRIFRTSHPVVIFPSSGTGAWEAALVNTLSPGDKVLMFETGYFATLWYNMAAKMNLNVDFVPGNWRQGVDSQIVEEKLSDDKDRRIKSVMVVHNETSTGVTSSISDIRKAMDRTGHSALLMVDTISSLASIDYHHEKWAVDVSISCSQKGLMLPPGLGFNAVSDKALAASKSAGLPGSYWNWAEMIESNKQGFFPYTPATNLLYGLKESIDLLEKEGLENVFARHQRHAKATCLAVRSWGLELLCQDEKELSNSLTAVMMPEGYSADAFRKVVLEKFNMSLGNGLGQLADKVFRIGHLGDFNDLSLIATLAGVEMGLSACNIPHNEGGLQAAIEFLKTTS